MSPTPALLDLFAAAPSAAPWTPALLPGLAGWWDPSDLATITASSGKVSALADKSGNGRHLTQATGTWQPSTGTRTINGLNALDFEGNDMLARAVTLAQPFTCLYVVAHDVFPVGGYHPVLCGGNSHALSFGVRNTQVFQMWAIERFGGATLGVGVPYLGSFVANGATSSEIWLNGTSVDAGNPGTNGITTVTLGGTTVGGVLDALLGESILCSGVLSVANRQAAESYLRTKWGTP